MTRPSRGATRSIGPVGSAWLGALVLIWAGCAGPPTDDTPSGALRAFLDALAAAQQEETGEAHVEALERALSLVDAESRARIEERARTTGALGSREHDAWEMLAIYPTRGDDAPPAVRASGFRESLGVDADHVTVTVRLGGERSIDVPMVREGDAWRVVLAVPETAAEDE